MIALLLIARQLLLCPALGRLCLLLCRLFSQLFLHVVGKTFAATANYRDAYDRNRLTGRRLLGDHR